MFCQQPWRLHYSFPLSTLPYLIQFMISIKEIIFKADIDFKQKTN